MNQNNNIGNRGLSLTYTGPVDIIENGINGVLDQDIKKAALTALEIDSRDCINYAKQYSWGKSAEALAAYLEPISYSAAGNDSLVSPGI
ncbi:MAG: hypothetical protein HY356_08250 [Gammaproteobacteria bacterium]|nr:hypothetical protein [Gammaproteobacteria bacterium]